MIDLRIDNDLVITNGDIAGVSEPDASGQRIKDRLSTFRGEWFLDLGFGVPYYDNILVKSPRLDVISAILKTEILKSATGEFVSFEASIDSRTRHLEIESTIQTPDGETTVSVTV